ncbi:MAG: hypothetical protein WCD35_14165 [Mycobacteriales bacterium]
MFALDQSLASSYHVADLRAQALRAAQVRALGSRTQALRGLLRATRRSA